MLMLISPAKTLDFAAPVPSLRYTSPRFMDDAAILAARLRQFAPHELSRLMAISDQLGVLNFDRYQQWGPPFTGANSRPALLAFKGDVYTGMAADGFSTGELRFAQQHLRILSGLYGLLRPLDLIQPYRLEMGSRLANPRGRDLYAFWGDRITGQLRHELAASGEVLVNLASAEYFRVVQAGDLGVPVITPVFKEGKRGRYKIVSFYAKKARGMMAAFVIRNRLHDVEQLKAFADGGYAYDGELSTPEQWIFTRPRPQ